MKNQNREFHSFHSMYGELFDRQLSESTLCWPVFHYALTVETLISVYVPEPFRNMYPHDHTRQKQNRTLLTGA